MINQSVAHPLALYIDYSSLDTQKQNSDKCRLELLRPKKYYTGKIPVYRQNP